MCVKVVVSSKCPYTFKIAVLESTRIYILFTVPKSKSLIYVKLIIIMLNLLFTRFVFGHHCMSENLTAHINSYLHLYFETLCPGI